MHAFIDPREYIHLGLPPLPLYFHRVNKACIEFIKMEEDLIVHERYLLIEN